MLEQINQDIKTAMKEKNKAKLEALRYLKAMLLENKTAKKPIDEMDVIIKHQKKLQDSIETFPAGHSQIEKIKEELTHIAAYLPQPLTSDEVRWFIQQILANSEQANIGLVMKALGPQIKGRFNGKEANVLVQEELKKVNA